MSRAKTRRPGTRGSGRKSAHTIPNELIAAAELALDDLISSAERPSRDSILDNALDNVLDHAIDHANGVDIDGFDELDDVPIDDDLAITGNRSPAPPDPVARPSQLETPTPYVRGGTDEAALDAELPQLRVAIYEDADHLAAARSAVVAAGHSVQMNASSTSGAQKIIAAISAGELDAVVVALPGGEDIVAAALALEPQRPLVIGAFTGKATGAVKRALAAGADLAVCRPHETERLAPVLYAAQRLVRERRLAATARGAELVLRAKIDELTDPDPRGLQPFETFQRVLEQELQRVRRFGYPLSVALFAIDVPPPPPPAVLRGILRARAGNALIHTIRDVDVATQLDHERFLVLLPYTELTGAAGLARRVIAAVGDGDPVVSAGRAFQPRVVGAVAQAKLDEPLSFARLMKDVTRALDAARRDGAELAVQP